MDTILSSTLPQGKYYVYTLSYPESMGGYAFYVGKGKRGRIFAHERQAKRGIKSHKCNVIRKIWSHGEQVTRKKLAFFDSEEEAYWYEKALIFFMDGLTNLTDGGDGTSGYVPTTELRQKWSETRKNSPTYQEARRKSAESRQGSKASEETRRKMSESGKKKPPLTEEARRKIVKANTGRHFPKEFGMKTSERNKRRIQSEETRRRRGTSLRGRKRPPRSEAWCQKIAESHARRRLERAKLKAETIAIRCCEWCGDPLPPQAKGRCLHYCSHPKRCKDQARNVRRSLQRKKAK